MNRGSESSGFRRQIKVAERLKHKRQKTAAVQDALPAPCSIRKTIKRTRKREMKRRAEGGCHPANPA